MDYFVRNNTHVCSFVQSTRAGEIERMFIEDFQTHSKLDDNLLNILGPSAKKLGETMLASLCEAN